MAKQAELAREMITTKLEKGEQLRSVCSFRPVPFWAWILLGNLLLLFGIRNSYIGVTNKRLIIVPLNRLAKPIEEDIYSVPLTDVELKGKALLVKLPDKEKLKKYYMYTGLQRITGFDADEFKVVLNADEKFGPNLVGGVCPDCGHKNRADAKFCEKCGANIKGAVKQSGLPKETGKKPGLSPVLKIAIGVIGLITFISGALRLSGYSLNLSLPKFLTGAESSSEDSSEEESNNTLAAYITNPAIIIEEGTPITMVFDWLANTKEQVQDFIDNAEQEVVVNGTPAIVKITYSVISPDEDKGGFKTQVAAEIGNLPAGTNTITTTISWKQEITNGRESFGPGTLNEKVKKEAKIIVGSPSNGQKAEGDSAKAAQSPDISNCPPETDITIGEATWYKDTGDPNVFDGFVAIEIRNKLGWEKSEEMPSEPGYFAEEAFVGNQGGCEIDPEDDTRMVCLTEIDHKPSKMQLHLPYPWSASPEGFCVLEDANMPVVDDPCLALLEEIRTGELYWERGMATLSVYNTLGWEPYEENPGHPSILTSNGEHYTDLGCEVDPDNDTIMECRGPGTRKMGGVGMIIIFPWEGHFCEARSTDIAILNTCSTGSSYCIFTNACCPDGNICDAQGCYSNAPPAPSSDDDHYH